VQSLVDVLPDYLSFLESEPMRVIVDAIIDVIDLPLSQSKSFHHSR
jgi:hypothetical protein